MFYPITLEQGVFLKRYKRFFADIQVNDEVIVSHCPNTGSLRSINIPNSPCLFSRSNDPKRKLKATIEAIKVGESWVGLHTGRANELVKDLVLKAPWLPYHKWASHFSEVKISAKSRSDFVLHNDIVDRPKPNDFERGGYHIIEVKNVTLAEGGIAMFPDAVTTRGQKHIEELSYLQSLGNTVEFIFLVQRTDCKHFCPAEEIDLTYSQLLREAVKKGLKVRAPIIEVSPEGYRLLDRDLEVKI